jgi:hypothetical protein
VVIDTVVAVLKIAEVFNLLDVVGNGVFRDELEAEFSF